MLNEIKSLVQKGFLVEKNGTSIERQKGRYHVIRSDWKDCYKDFGNVYDDIDIALDKFLLLMNEDTRSIDPRETDNFRYDVKFNGWVSCRNRKSKV